MSPVRLPTGAVDVTQPRGTLFVVATPIGNLEDITLRALRILREVDVVAAEDTRRTGNLLRYYKIPKPLLSLHEHNERDRIAAVVERLSTGHSVALVSDAGTPGISDPGALIVAAVRAAGLPVTPIPGPSSVSAILSVSGFDGPVTVRGFVPNRSKDRHRWVLALRELSNQGIVCFESPHRLRSMLVDFGREFGERPILIGREVTKVHEEWRLAPAADHLAHFVHPKGEFVLFIFPPKTEEPAREPVPDEEILTLFGQLTDSPPVSRRQAVKIVADRLQLSPRDVYGAIERAKKLVSRPT